MVNWKCGYKLVRLKVPRSVKIIYSILFFVGLIGFSFYKFSNTAAIPISKHRLMQAELDQVKPLDGDHLESNASGYHTYRAFGRRDYRSTHLRSVVADYYKKLLSTSGWTYIDRENGSITFCRGGDVLTLDFADVKATRYSLGYTLDGDSTSKDVVRDCR